MNEQQKTVLRQLLMMGGSSLTTWLVTKGYLTTEMASFFTSNALVLGSLIIMGLGSLLSFLARRQSSMIASVAEMTGIKPADQAVLAATVAELPSVGKVVGAPTAAGDALVAAAPSSSVVSAGS